MQEAKRGDRVSLILAKRSYFFQTVGGISLNEENNSAIIPDSATDEHLRQINMAIGNEHLVLGVPERKADMPDRDSDIQNTLKLGTNKIKDWIYNIRVDKSVRQAEKVAVLEKTSMLEKSGKNRKAVIEAVDLSLRIMGGVSPVSETEQEKVEIKLTSGTEEHIEK